MNDAIFPILYCSCGLCSSLYTNIQVNRHTRRERVSSAMDGELKYFHVVWIPAQICLEQICINLKGDRQDSLSCIPAEMSDLYITMNAGAWQ
jgi:hypothetical protein